jgi:hypothetical protein
VELRELPKKRLGEKQKLRLACVERASSLKTRMGPGWVSDVPVSEVSNYGGELVVFGNVPSAEADRMVEFVGCGCENSGGGFDFRGRFQKSGKIA